MRDVVTRRDALTRPKTYVQARKLTVDVVRREADMVDMVECEYAVDASSGCSDTRKQG